MADPISSALPESFPQMRWAVVLSARQHNAPGADEALATLCRGFWYPIYAFIRRTNPSARESLQATQEFFYLLLEKKWPESIEREKSRLRMFLLVALKRFIAKEWRHVATQRPIGTRLQIPIDAAFAEQLYCSRVKSQLPPDQLFDQQWALTLRDLTLKRLKIEFAAAGQLDTFETMKQAVISHAGDADYSAIALHLECSETVARTAVHHLRKRFRELHRDEVARTLAHDANVDQELLHLGNASRNSV